MQIEIIDNQVINELKKHLNDIVGTKTILKNDFDIDISQQVKKIETMINSAIKKERIAILTVAVEKINGENVGVES